MALKGQGDPRWIVEQREDGRNVNNWHWTESDFTGWYKEKATTLFKDLPVETNDITCKITSVTFEGDASVNTRKKKTILFYEFDITLKWEGTLNATGTSGKGTIQMPYISEENDHDDFEVKLTVEAENENTRNLKDKLRTAVIPILKEKVNILLTGLKEIALGQTRLPPKDAPTAKLDQLTTVPPPVATPAPAPAPATTTAPAPATATPTPKPTPSAPVKSGARLANITLTEKFMCPPRDLFSCFVDPNRVKAFAGGDAVMNGEKGGKFSLFGNSVTGENVEVDVPKKLVQKWRFSSWPENHYSTVKIELEEKSGKTVLTLTQTDVPEDDRARAEAGWNNNFFRRIKGIFGYGPLQ